MNRSGGTERRSPDRPVSRVVSRRADQEIGAPVHGKNSPKNSRLEPLNRRKTSNTQHPTSNHQWFPIGPLIGCWMLDVGCSMFPRVQGKGRGEGTSFSATKCFRNRGGNPSPYPSEGEREAPWPSQTEAWKSWLWKVCFYYRPNREILSIAS